MPALCPRCRGADVAFSSNALKSAGRRLTGSNHRFCRGCRYRWRARRNSLSGPLLVAAAAIAAGALVWRAERGPKDEVPAAGFADASGAGTGLSFARESSSAGDRALARAAAARLGDEPAQERRFEVVRKENDFGFVSLIRSLIQGRDEAELRAMSKMSKKQLWDRYGRYFASKEDAKAAYEEARKRQAVYEEARKRLDDGTRGE